MHLLNVQRRTKRNTVTNNDGSYSFPGLQPGLYTVTAEQTGFETSSVKDVQVIIDQHARVDIVLKLGAVSQSVVVNAGGAAPLLDTAPNSLGTVMDSARVENLPLNGRRGVLFGPGSQTWDMSFAKQFPIYESLKVEFQGDLFNIWNHTNFGMPGAGMAGANFGRVTSAGDPRLIQLAGRIVW